MCIGIGLSFVIRKNVMSKKSRTCRIAVRIGIGIFLGLAHFAWFCFYLPESLLLSSISFICVSIYAHMAVFLLVMIVVELISNWLLPDINIPVLKSKNFHTILAFSLAIAFTSFGIVVTQRQPLIHHENVSIPGLAPELDGFSIGLVTDVHVGPTVGRDRVETIVGVMNGLDADIVAVVGDLVDGFVSNLGQRAKPLQRLRSRYGTFFVTGNHEYYHDNVDRWIDFFKSNLNFTVLRNANEVIRPSVAAEMDTENGRASVCVVGVDDIVTDHLFIQGHEMNVTKAIAGCPPLSTVVMLAHQPNAARRIIDEAKRKVHLIISGHTHGGQFYIFWPLAYWRNAYLYGLYRDSESGTQIYVSSGVNYWGPPVKMWNLCEVVLLRLRPGRQKIMWEFDGEPPFDALPPPPTDTKTKTDS